MQYSLSLDWILCNTLAEDSKFHKDSLINKMSLRNYSVALILSLQMITMFGKCIIIELSNQLCSIINIIGDDEMLC